jgi:hypothetical protein
VRDLRHRHLEKIIGDEDTFHLGDSLNLGVMCLLYHHNLLE